MKAKQFLLLALSAQLFLMTGCSFEPRLSFENMQTLKNMDDEEFDYFFTNYIMDERSFDEIQPLVNASISIYPEKALDIIDALIYNTKLSISRYMSMVYINSDIFRDAKWTEDGLLETVPTNPSIKGLIDELTSKHLILKKVIDDFVIVLDYDYFIDKYGDYMDEDILAYYQFNKEIDQYEMFTATGLDYTYLKKHLLDIQKIILFNKHTSAVNNSIRTYEDFLSDWFGASLSNAFIDDQNQVYVPILNYYKEFMETEPTNLLTPVIKNVLAYIEDNDGIIDTETYPKYIENVISEHINVFIQGSSALTSNDETTNETSNETSINKALDAYNK